MAPLITPAAFVAQRLHRMASVGRGIASAFLPSSKGVSGPAPSTSLTPKPACKTPYELAASIASRNALPPHSRKRAPMLKAIYSDRHDVLRRGPAKEPRK